MNPAANLESAATKASGCTSGPRGQFGRMDAAATAAGHNRHVNGGYRAYREQAALYRAYLNGTADLSRRAPAPKGKEGSLETAARPNAPDGSRDLVGDPHVPRALALADMVILRVYSDCTHESASGPRKGLRPSRHRTSRQSE